MSGEPTVPRAGSPNPVKQFFSWKTVRRLHLYLGCFFAPLLLFYVLTGWYQTLNPDRLKTPGEAETFLQRVRTVHVDQIYPTDSEFDKPSSPRPFQVLASIMCFAATVTIVLGMALAFKTLRHQWPVWVSLILGLAIPIVILWLGHG